MYPHNNTQSGGYPPTVQYPYSYSTTPSYHYSTQQQSGVWQQPMTSVAQTQSSWPVSQPAQTWCPPLPSEEPPPPGTTSDQQPPLPPPSITGEEPPPPPPPPPPPDNSVPHNNNNSWQNSYWQSWQTQGWTGSVNQWNGQWPSQQPYWNTTYNYGNTQPYNNSTGPAANQGMSQTELLAPPSSQEIVPDRTPPPPPTHNDTTPPPAIVDGIHQPRIQQYSHTGYTTELPAVPNTLQHTSQPSITTSHTKSNDQQNKSCLLPDPVVVSSHEWKDNMKNRPLPRKRQSRWEQQPSTEVIERGHNDDSSVVLKKAKVSQSPLTPDQWPPKLRGYIDRAFAACEGRQADLEKVQEFLKVQLNDIFRQNRAWDVDWDSKPLPLGQQTSYTSRWDTPSPTSDVHSRLSYHPVTPTVNSGGRGKRKRAGLKKKRGGKLFFIDKAGDTMSEQDHKRLNQRAQRFADGNKSFKKKLSVAELVQAASVGGKEDGGDLDWEEFIIEGTSHALEKPYLRLTSAPDPSTVRPQHILRQSLVHVMSKWKNKKDYRYTCEQFKSIRQDLTIQGIRNEFTVTVYEAHARIALENGDRGEFNQCQAQLKALYLEGVAGQEAEFVAYRILYLILTHNSADMSAELRDLTSDLKQHPYVSHALKLWSSWQLGNYHRFFQLYKNAPGSGRSLLELFLSRERLSALRTILKAFRPTCPVTYLSNTLAFPTLEECMEWLVELELPLNNSINSITTLDCKICLPLLQTKITSNNN